MLTLKLYKLINLNGETIIYLILIPRLINLFKTKGIPYF
jgi:hypothetical protein